MQAVNIFLAVFLAILATGLAGYILWAIIGAFLPGLKGLPDRMCLRRHQATLAEAEALLERGHFESAWPALQGSFIFEHIKTGPLIEKVASHNLSTLARLVAAAEITSTRLPNLPILEDLLATRHGLLRGFLEVQETTVKIKKRPAHDGKDIPEWALSEFSKKLTELKEKLETNKRSLDSQLKETFALLKKQPAQSEVTYH
ncbi:MAG: hypothetical protein K1X79_00025 [Oligoflexia bacterium]|nr:hypothetical protein [Oligoflexia bacterium]